LALKGLGSYRRLRAGLPLFTELPRRGILGNWAPDILDSRKLRMAKQLREGQVYCCILPLVGIAIKE